MKKLQKAELIKVAENTKERINKIGYISPITEMIFEDDFKGDKKEVSIFREDKTEIEVINSTTLDAIYSTKDVVSKVCVLNFASPTKPGGGWENGILAQEETLARNSDLMSSLLKEGFYYSYHKGPGKRNGLFTRLS